MFANDNDNITIFIVLKQSAKCMKPVVYMFNKILVDTSYYNVFAFEECAKTASQRNWCNPITPMRKNSSIIRYFLKCRRRICGIHLSKKRKLPSRMYRQGTNPFCTSMREFFILFCILFDCYVIGGLFVGVLAVLLIEVRTHAFY